LYTLVHRRWVIITTAASICQMSRCRIRQPRREKVWLSVATVAASVDRSTTFPSSGELLAQKCGTWITLYVR
jgi:hypothetical protein